MKARRLHDGVGERVSGGSWDRSCSRRRISRTAAALRHVVADRARNTGYLASSASRTERRVGGPGPPDRPRLLEARQGAQVGRELDSDHGSVCTSTERTAGDPDDGGPGVAASGKRTPVAGGAEVARRNRDAHAIASLSTLT